MQESPGDPAAVPGQRLHRRPCGRAPGRCRWARRVPHRDEDRLWFALRVRDGGHSSGARDPDASGYRVPGRYPPGRRDLPGPKYGRPRLGRGVLRGVWVAPVRAHARARRPPERASWHVPEPPNLSRPLGGDLSPIWRADPPPWVYAKGALRVAREGGEVQARNRRWTRWRGSTVRARGAPSVLRAILPGGDSVQDHFEGSFTGRVVTHDQLAVNQVPQDRREVARAFKHHEINVIAR